MISYIYLSAIDAYLLLLDQPENVAGFPGTGVTDDCKPLCVCWELTLGPL